MLKVGITGGIGSGKSFVCAIFKQLGVPIYDADSRAKALMVNNEEVITKVKNLLGEQAYFSDGRINNLYISKVVFNNNELLKQLNDIVHPAVALDFEKWANSQKSSIVIKEAALLIESGSYQKLDKLIVVTAPEWVRKKRVMARDPFRSEDQIQSIFSKQLDENIKLKYADFVLVNDDQQLLLPQVVEVYKQLINCN
jgi:dephospho-CoA kinase